MLKQLKKIGIIFQNSYNFTVFLSNNCSLDETFFKRFLKVLSTPKCEMLWDVTCVYGKLNLICASGEQVLLFRVIQIDGPLDLCHGEAISNATQNIRLHQRNSWGIYQGIFTDISCPEHSFESILKLDLHTHTLRPSKKSFTLSHTWQGNVCRFLSVENGLHYTAWCWREAQESHYVPSSHSA